MKIDDKVLTAVAAAIYNQDSLDLEPFLTPELKDIPWEKCSEFEKEDYVRLAQAAITAYLKETQGQENTEFEKMVLSELDRVKKLTYRYNLPKAFDGLGQTLAQAQGCIMKVPADLIASIEQGE